MTDVEKADPRDEYLKQAADVFIDPETGALSMKFLQEGALIPGIESKLHTNFIPWYQVFEIAACREVACVIGDGAKSDYDNIANTHFLKPSDLAQIAHPGKERKPEPRSIYKQNLLIGTIPQFKKPRILESASVYMTPIGVEDISDSEVAELLEESKLKDPKLVSFELRNIWLMDIKAIVRSEGSYDVKLHRRSGLVIRVGNVVDNDNGVETVRWNWVDNVYDLLKKNTEDQPSINLRGVLAYLRSARNMKNPYRGGLPGQGQ